jgi:hypothetical protein
MIRISVVLLVVIAACKSEKAAPPPATGSSAVAPAPAIDASMLSQLMADARAAVAEQRWVDAVVSARSAQQLDPANAEAATIARQAMKEGRHEGAYKEVIEAVKHMDRAAATAAFEKIPADSYYKPLATETLEMLDAK